MPNKGCAVEIGLILAGSALNYLPEYIRAVRALFTPGASRRRVSGAIAGIESLDCSGARNPIMKGDGVLALDRVATISARDLLDMNTLDPSRIRLTLMTPMRILQDGQPIRSFSFSPFLRSLLRRISSLAYYYYRNDSEIDYRWLAAASKMVEVAENDFHWTDWQGRGSDRLNGITGSGSCLGSLEQFHLFLLLGEYFHAGKGAAFGLGRYRLGDTSGSKYPPAEPGAL